MQKRKTTKKDEVSKMNMDNDTTEFLYSIAEEMNSMHGIPIGLDHVMGDMLTTIINSSIELSKIVIENRVRNSDHMIDDDIYEIHNKSLQSIKNAMDNFSKE